MERYNSTYKDISMRGTPAELIRKHEGLAFQAERDGDSYMMCTYTASIQTIGKE